jgi:hypothetical protein
MSTDEEEASNKAAPGEELKKPGIYSDILYQGSIVYKLQQMAHQRGQHQRHKRQKHQRPKQRSRSPTKGRKAKKTAKRKTHL